MDVTEVMELHPYGLIVWKFMRVCLSIFWMQLMVKKEFQDSYFALSQLSCSRLRLKCVGTSAETRFRLSAKRTSPFKSAGASVQSTTGSRGVRISGSNAGYTMPRSSGYPNDNNFTCPLRNFNVDSLCVKQHVLPLWRIIRLKCSLSHLTVRCVPKIKRPRTQICLFYLVPEQDSYHRLCRWTQDL